MFAGVNTLCDCFSYWACRIIAAWKQDRDRVWTIINLLNFRCGFAAIKWNRLLVCFMVSANALLWPVTLQGGFNLLAKYTHFASELCDLFGTDRFYLSTSEVISLMGSYLSLWGEMIGAIIKHLSRKMSYKKTERRDSARVMNIVQIGWTIQGKQMHCCK